MKNNACLRFNYMILYLTVDTRHQHQIGTSHSATTKIGNPSRSATEMSGTTLYLATTMMGTTLHLAAGMMIGTSLHSAKATVTKSKTFDYEGKKHT